jgi:hypothetical protein
MAVIVDWNGVDVPEEQETGLEAALASVREGQGFSRDEAYAKAKATLE